MNNQLPELAFGIAALARLPIGERDEALRRAYEVGYRHFDTASPYLDGDGLAIIGRALPVADFPDINVTTKYGLASPRTNRLRWLARTGRTVVRRVPALSAARQLGRLTQKISPTDPTSVRSEFFDQLDSLGRERVFALLWHEIPPAGIDPDAATSLSQIRADGLTAHLGVSGRHAWTSPQHPGFTVRQGQFSGGVMPFGKEESQTIVAYGCVRHYAPLIQRLDPKRASESAARTGLDVRKREDVARLAVQMALATTADRLIVGTGSESLAQKYWADRQRLAADTDLLGGLRSLKSVVDETI